MYIKKIIEYNFNYAEYYVSDGAKQLRCVCMSVPLPEGKEPVIGLLISKIFAFSMNDIKLDKITNQNKMKYLIKKNTLLPLAYKLKGKIIDKKEALIKIFDFIISLKNDYPNGFDDSIKINDFVQFSVDRLDCIIENTVN